MFSQYGQRIYQSLCALSVTENNTLIALLSPTRVSVTNEGNVFGARRGYKMLGFFDRSQIFTINRTHCLMYFEYRRRRREG
jgi:hypothetical protein